MLLTVADLSVWRSTLDSLPGALAAGVFDAEGMMIDGYAADPAFHMDHAAASFLTVLTEAREAAKLMELSGVDEVQLKLGDVTLLLRPLSGSDRGLTLGLAARDSVPLGRIRMAVDILQRKLPGTRSHSSVPAPIRAL